MELGASRPTFYFDVHGEVNTDKTIELARERADELGIAKVVVASETGLSALKVLDAFPEHEVIVVSSAVGTTVDGSVIGDLKIGLPDGDTLTELRDKGARVVRGADPFWNLSAHTDLLDTSKLGMMRGELRRAGHRHRGRGRQLSELLRRFRGEGGHLQAPEAPLHLAHQPSGLEGRHREIQTLHCRAVNP